MTHDKDIEEELAALRGQLDAIDGEWMALVAERMRIVKAIGEVKARGGRGVFDRERERRVIEGARRRADEVGLDPAVGQSLMHTLLEASHKAQESVGSVATSKQAGPARRVLIVGGRGGMGRLFGDAFGRRGHTVDVIDKGDPLDEARIKAADAVVLSVPMGLAVEMAGAVAPHVRPGGLLCDINSLKYDICGVYAGHDGSFEALGTHPMFGPTVGTLRRQKVVVCPVHEGPLTAWFLDELSAMGVELIDATPEAHDRMMAVVQVLVHFRTLVMGEALRRCAISIEDSLRFTSPIYRLELAVVGRLFDQDPQLYAEIEMQNPFGDEVRRHFLGAASSMAELIEGGDRERFEEAFLGVRGYFDAFAEEAMALSDFVIEALVSRA